MHAPIPHALCALAAAFLAAGVHAATVVESVAGPDRTPTLLTVDKGRAKTQTDPVNYMLIDPGIGQFFYITHDKKLVVDMNAAPPADPSRKPAAPPKVLLVQKGTGPKIAGFPTRGYQLVANGTLCLTTYLSREAMNGELKDFHIGFARLQAKQKEGLRAAGARYAPCDDAQDLLTARYPELGLAMRTVLPGGQVIQEVVKIDNDASVAANLYDVPKDFKKLTHEQFLRHMEGTAEQTQLPEKKAGS